MKNNFLPNSGFLVAHDGTEYFAMVVGWICGLIFAHTIYCIFKAIKSIVFWLYHNIRCRIKIGYEKV